MYSQFLRQRQTFSLRMLFTLNTGTGTPHLALFHFLSPFSLSALLKQAATPFHLGRWKSSKVLKQEMTLSDQVYYIMEGVQFCFGCGMVVTFPWDITFIGLKRNRLLGTGMVLSKWCFSCLPICQEGPLPLPVKLFPVKVDLFFFF